MGRVESACPPWRLLSAPLADSPCDPCLDTVCLSLMSWHQCRLCGWWQKQRGACIGCTRRVWSSWPSSGASNKPKPKLDGAMQTPPESTLQQRWQAAKTSSMDPRHLKIEVMCTRCFTRSLTARPTCRSCSLPMQDCYKVVPGQDVP